jgi:hypothetical protein
VFDKLTQADVLDAGVTIADGAEAVSALQAPQARQHVIIKFDLLARREKHVEAIARQLRAIVVVQFTEVLQKIPAHCRQIDGIAWLTTGEFAPTRDQLLAIITLGNSGVVTLQPEIQGFLRAPYGWHAGPQGIVEIEGDDIYLA